MEDQTNAELDRRPALDRAAALRALDEAKRLYALADAVQGRRLAGGIDSAVFAQRGFSGLLRLFLRLHAETVPADHASLVARAQSIVVTESLMAEDLSGDLLVIDEMARLYVSSDVEPTPADARRYDRAFVRAEEWLRAAESYVDQKLPPPVSRTRSRLFAAFGMALVFSAGLVIGRHVRSDSPPAVVEHVSAAPAPLVEAPPGPAFSATFFRDATFGQRVLSRRDTNIAFDWQSESPAESVPNDHFSVRWEAVLNVTEPKTYTFYLTSDDGSRLFLDGALAVDNWGGHSVVTKTTDIALKPGPHALRLEYFDEVGAAVVRLEWSSDAFPRRPVTSADLR